MSMMLWVIALLLIIMSVSDTDRQHIMSGVIFKSGANVSDHMPLIYCFQFGFSIYASKPASTCSTLDPTMPNVMAALPNIDGTLCSMPQFG